MPVNAVSVTAQLAKERFSMVTDRTVHNSDYRTRHRNLNNPSFSGRTPLNRNVSEQVKNQKLGAVPFPKIG